MGHRDGVHQGKDIAAIDVRKSGKIRSVFGAVRRYPTIDQSKRIPMLNTIYEKMHRKITQSELDATTRYELHTLWMACQAQKSLSWRLQSSNVIVRDDGTPFILDWAHVTQGNGGADAARTYLLFNLDDDAKPEKNT
jgi:hypothetical protein